LVNFVNPAGVARVEVVIIVNDRNFEVVDTSLGGSCEPLKYFFKVTFRSHELGTFTC